MGMFDDLIPQQPGGIFDDLVPAAPSPEDQRRERLRKIARAALPQDPGASDLYSDAYTLGLMKPVGAVAGALGGEVREMFGGEPASFGERYRAGTEAYQDMLGQARENAGWGGTAAELAGGLTSGRAPRAPAGFGKTLAGITGLGAVEGAARNSEDPINAAEGAALGGVTAGGTAAVVGGLTKGLGFRARRRERLANRGPGPEELRGQARQLYKRLDEAGIAYNDMQATDLADEIFSDLRQNRWSPSGVHKPLNGVLRQVQKLRDRPMSLETLQSLRSQLSAEAASNEPEVRRIAGRALSVIDGYVSNVNPALSQIPAEEVAPTWKEARRLWRTANTAEDIGWRVQKAEDRAASTNSGGNVENAIRQNVRQALDKGTQPRRFNPYNEAEIAQMRRVVEGTRPQNLLRGIGNTFGGTGPLGSVSAGGVGGVGMLAGLIQGQEPTTAAILGASALGGTRLAGKMARAGATRIAEDEADTLMRLISTGSKEMPGPTREALARLMREQALARGAGLYGAGQFYD